MPRRCILQKVTSRRNEKSGPFIHSNGSHETQIPIEKSYAYLFASLLNLSNVTDTNVNQSTSFIYVCELKRYQYAKCV